MTSTPPDRVVVGVDVGTTGTKAVAFGLDRPWRHVAVREYPLLQPEPGHEVQDPQAVAVAVTSAIREAVGASGGADVVALSVSAAMHGLVGLDATGRPVTPLVTWADARARDEVRQLARAGLAADLHQRTGTPVHPMSPLAKLMWFARHEPGTAASVRWWLGLKDYVLLHLTGTVATELSSASATGLLDLRSGTWHAPALELAGVAADQLPPVLRPTATLELSADAAARTGLAPGTPVVAGAADGPLGNVGTGALRPGIVGLSLGTSGAVRALVQQPPDELDESLFCYALDGDAWTVGAAISNGGIVVRWAGAALAPDVQGDTGCPRDAAVLKLAAGAPPGSDGLVMLPYLLPERAPLWNPDLRGAYLGLQRGHTRAHLVRAAVEGVCLQLSALVDQLDRLEPIRSVRATGGVFRSPLWRDVLAASLGRPVTIVGQSEGSALGAAALGLVALGQAPSLAAAADRLATPGHDDVEVVPDSALVATYARTRQSVATLLDDLATVRKLFAAGASTSTRRRAPYAP